jgi:hypothetical protein
MQTSTCNSAIWLLVLIAVVLFTLQGRIGLLAVVLPISLLLAWAMMWRGNHASKLTSDPEKR